MRHIHYHIAFKASDVLIFNYDLYVVLVFEIDIIDDVLLFVSLMVGTFSSLNKG